MNGADPNHVNVYGKTALMLAAGQEEGTLLAFLFLLMYQANAKFTNEFGENAVFISSRERPMRKRYNIFNSTKQIL